MSTPATLSFTFSYPPDDGLPAASITKTVQAVFDSKQDDVVSLTGSGTKTVDLGSILTPGCKGILVYMYPDAAASPVIAKFNGDTNGIEVSPGGFIASGSPAPVSGVLSLSLTHTTACRVRIVALG